MLHLSSLNFCRCHGLMPIICQCLKLDLHIPPGNKEKNTLFILSLTLFINFVFVFILFTGHVIHAGSEILALEVINNQKFPYSRICSQVLLNVMILAV